MIFVQVKEDVVLDPLYGAPATYLSMARSPAATVAML